MLGFLFFKLDSTKKLSLNFLKSILSSNKDTIDSVKNLKSENSSLMKGLKKSQQKLIQFYSDFYSSKFFKENDYNFLIQKLDTENDLMRSLSFNLIGKVLIVKALFEISSPYFPSPLVIALLSLFFSFPHHQKTQKQLPLK